LYDPFICGLVSQPGSPWVQPGWTGSKINPYWNL